MTNLLLSSIISGFIGTIVGVFLKEFLEFIKSKNSEFSGEWTQLIYVNDTETIKKDKVKVIHYGNRIKGKIQRLDPSTENHKKWKFEGYFLDDLFFGTFQTTDRRRNPGSYGVLLLRKTILESKVTLEGSYVKSDTQPGSKKGDLERKIIVTPLVWERKTGA